MVQQFNLSRSTCTTWAELKLSCVHACHVSRARSPRVHFDDVTCASSQVSLTIHNNSWPQFCNLGFGPTAFTHCPWLLAKLCERHTCRSFVVLSRSRLAFVMQSAVHYVVAFNSSGISALQGGWGTICLFMWESRSLICENCSFVRLICELQKAEL